jgi:hypothetical protein
MSDTGFPYDGTAADKTNEIASKGVGLLDLDREHFGSSIPKS